MNNREQTFLTEDNKVDIDELRQIQMPGKTKGAVLVESLIVTTERFESVLNE